ncbi:MAG TPA: cytochrome P450 [Burkholderiales bacterium]|nr:cytochrome P450 [Burkholderiales bacterium]
MDRGDIDVRGFQLAEAPPAFFDDPYPWYAALREQDPVHEMQGGVFVSRYEDALAVYRDPRASSDKKVEFKPKFGDSPLYEHHTTSLVFNDAPYHARVRRLMLGALNQRAIARMEKQVEILVDGLLENIPDKADVDLIGDFAARIPVEVVGNLLDIPHGERGELRAWSIAILSGLEPRLTPEMHARGNAAVREFVSFLEGLIAERTKRPGDPDSDVLTRLIQGDGEKLSAAELQHNCIFLLNAGHETTTNLIGNGVWLLLKNENQKERLRSEPHLISSAIEEMLRYEGPIQLNNRRLTAAMELGGRKLPEGTLITIGIGAANRDPRQFPEAERFDVARRPNRHLAFGQGEHACAGMNVARMEGRIALARLLARFPRLAPGGTPERDRRVRFRGFRKLPVTL